MSPKQEGLLLYMKGWNVTTGLLDPLVRDKF